MLSETKAKAVVLTKSVVLHGMPFVARKTENGEWALTMKRRRGVCAEEFFEHVQDVLFEMEESHRLRMFDITIHMEDSE